MNTMHETIIPFEVDGQPCAPFLCTPDNLTELAVGRLITQGIVRELSDIRAVRRDEDGLHARLVTAAQPEMGFSQRIAHATAFSQVRPHSARQVQRMVDALTSCKGVFGTHRVVVLSPQGLEVFEDVARHNAADKAIGHAVLRRWDLQNTALLSSGRLTLEIALKCALAGIPRCYTIKYTSDLAEEFAKGIHMQLLSRVARNGGDDVQPQGV